MSTNRPTPPSATLYPTGMHQCIADALNSTPGIHATTATLDQPDHGLPPGRLRKPTC
jgi:trehalose utilization protein